MRSIPSCARRMLAVAAAAYPFAGCAGGTPGFLSGGSEVNPEEVRHALSVLAADSMLGRRTGTAGAAQAARFIAAELHRAGVQPAFPVAVGDDSAYFQTVPFQTDGRGATLSLPPPGEAVPAQAAITGVNVIGVLPGSDPTLRDEAVIVGAHYDHLGTGAAVGGDSIFNGADDDASGVVTVLQIARALAAGPAPERTVVFLLSTAEEQGLLGTLWYLRDPVVPLDRTVADLQVEMVGRPDSEAGGAGRAWLTGYGRSSLGDALAAENVPIVPDPRPAQRFFERSDNIAFACRGIPAHTLSSFSLHGDYHSLDDEVDRIDIDHLVRVIAAATRAVQILAAGEAPVWQPGGDPSADPDICG